ncbi:MAG: HAD family hydrolase [Thermoplasmata archaeon]|nr:HAD family hydrolase [Thermoplasmata archaeon]
MQRALLLDIDGTLFDSFEAILASMNEALAEDGEPPLLETDLRPLIGMPVRRQMALIRGMEGPAVERLSERYYLHFEEHVEAGIALYPGVRETLETLAERPIGTITTRRTAVARRMLEGADLSVFFTSVTGGDAVARPKPAPDLVHHAARAVGRSASDCVAVGDAPVDLRAGRAAGARTVAALYGYGGVEALREVEPDGEIPTFSDLPATLEELD